MDDFSLDAMANPALVEKRILDAYEEYVTKGESVVVDANNTFMFIVEMFAQMNSDSVQAIMNKFNALYPQRALTPEDLYMHMSDYDYVNLFGSPASVTMEIILGKQELIDNAVAISGIDTYKKIVIPKDTIFSIGDYKFGLHYPIEIRINNITKSFTVVYDTSSDEAALDATNPFIQLSTNTVEYAIQSYKDIDIVALRFPVYQFEKTEMLLDTTSTAGFSTTISYTDKFYALRIFRNVDNEWQEMSQTLSDVVYDPMTPTAKLVVDTEDKKVKVTIPQIYFTSGLISGQLKFEVYTTLGAMDVDITNISTNQVSATFNGNTTENTLDEYSRPLDRAQTIQVYPISTKIVGGSDGYTFESLRTKVINNTFYSKVIRFAELESKLADEGFGVAKYQDSIMNRIFFCTKDITDLNGETIASGNIQLHLPSTLVSQVEDGSVIPTNYQWLRYRASDSSFMILPQALMVFDPDTNISNLVENDDYPDLEATQEARAAAYNKAQYTYNPFHLKVIMNNRYPVAYSYNLMAPSVDRIFFRGNNAAIGQTINGYTGTIVHNNGGSGGYTLRIAVTLSQDLIDAIENSETLEQTTEAGGVSTTTSSYKQDIWLTDIIAYLKYSSSSEASDGCFAILTPTLEKMDDKYIFELELETDYYINSKHYIEFNPVRQIEEASDGTLTQTQGYIAANGMVPIQSEDWTLTFLIKKDKLKYIAPTVTDNEVDELSDTELASYTEGANDAEIGVYALEDLGDDFLPISEQQLTLNFGTYVSQVFNDVEVFTGERTYETYATTRYLNNGRDVYLRGSDNTITRFTNGSGTKVVPVETQAYDFLLDSDRVDFTASSIDIVEEQVVFESSMTASNAYYGLTTSDGTFAYKFISTDEDANDEDPVYLKDAFYETITSDMADGEHVYYIDGKAVLLTNLNIENHVGKSCPRMVPVTARKIQITTTDIPVSTSLTVDDLVGMSIVEKPETGYSSGNEVAVGVTKFFLPGMTIEKVTQTSDGYLLVLANKCINSDGVLSEVKNINYMIEYFKTQAVESDNYQGLITIDTTGNDTMATANTLLDNKLKEYQELFLLKKDGEYLPLKFYVGNPLIGHTAGDVVIDSSGNSKVSERTFDYYVSAIQMDARAFLSADTTVNELRESISTMITDYVAVVDKYTPELLENTHLYYQPLRSIGNAKFSVGNDVIKTLPLQIATEFTLTVKSFVFEDDEIKSIITSKILEFVDASIDEATLSVTAISKMIMDELSDYVDAVAVSGFNTKEDLSGDLTSDEKMAAYGTQVLKVVDEDTKLSIRRIVYMNDRDLLDTKRGLTINFIT